MRTLAMTVAVAVLAIAADARAQLLAMSTRFNPMNAEHIFVFRYDGVLRVGESGYEDTPGTHLNRTLNPPLPYREATLKLTIVEELKGRLRQRRGVPFAQPIHDITLRTRGLPNIWTRRSHWQPGARLLAWCDGSSNDATVLLAGKLVDRHCENFREEPKAIEDTRAIVALERARAPLDTVLRTARAEVAMRGYVFAEYVGARMGLGPVTDDALGTVIDLAASSQVESAARAKYADILNTLLYAFGDPPRTAFGTPPRLALEVRWIRTLFRLATVPWPWGPDTFPIGDRDRAVALAHLPPLEDNHAGSLLAGAIGLFPLPESYLKMGYRPTPYHSADEVFSGAPDERAAAIAWVRNHSEVQWRKPMLDWLTKTTGP
jgi:hypothetical protein